LWLFKTPEQMKDFLGDKCKLFLNNPGGGTLIKHTVLFILAALALSQGWANASPQAPIGQPIFPAIWVDGIYQSDGIQTNGQTYVPLSLVINTFHPIISAKVDGGKNIINLDTTHTSLQVKPNDPAQANQVPQFETGKTVLKGLKSIAIVVNPVSIDLQSVGTTTDTLQAQCRVKLIDAGINVVDFNSLVIAPRPTAELDLTVSAAKVMDWPVYSYYVHLQLKRLSASVDDPKVRYINSIWEDITPTQSVPDTGLDGIQTSVDDVVGKFIDDYSSVNSK
jgi:phosphotransferase system IIB component